MQLAAFDLLLNPLYTSYAYMRNLFLALYFFHIIFTEDVYELIVTRANLYAAQQRSQKALFELSTGDVLFDIKRIPGYQMKACSMYF